MMSEVDNTNTEQSRRLLRLKVSYVEKGPSMKMPNGLIAKGYVHRLKADVYFHDRNHPRLSLGLRTRMCYGFAVGVQEIHTSIIPIVIQWG